MNDQFLFTLPQVRLLPRGVNQLSSLVFNILLESCFGVQGLSVWSVVGFGRKQILRLKNHLLK